MREFTTEFVIEIKSAYVVPIWLRFCRFFSIVDFYSGTGYIEIAVFVPYDRSLSISVRIFQYEHHCSI